MRYVLEVVNNKWSQWLPQLFKVPQVEQLQWEGKWKCTASPYAHGQSIAKQTKCHSWNVVCLDILAYFENASIFCLSYNLKTPIDKVIFEDTFVKLISGVKHVNILVCGRSPQNGIYTGLIPSFVKAGTWQPLYLCWRITFVHSCSHLGNCTNSPCSSCRTLHSGQWLPFQTLLWKINNVCG